MKKYTTEAAHNAFTQTSWNMKYFGEDFPNLAFNRLHPIVFLPLLATFVYVIQWLASIMQRLHHVPGHRGQNVRQHGGTGWANETGRDCRARFFALSQKFTTVATVQMRNLRGRNKTG